MLKPVCLPCHLVRPVSGKRWAWAGSGKVGLANGDWPVSPAVSSGVAAAGLIVADTTMLGVSMTRDWQATNEAATSRRSKNPNGRKLNG